MIVSGMGRSLLASAILYDVGKSALHFAKIPGAAGDQNEHNGDSYQHGGPVERGCAAEQRPAETVNDADHGVEGVKAVPFSWDNRAAKTYGRDEEAELHRSEERRVGKECRSRW